MINDCGILSIFLSNSDNGFDEPTRCKKTRCKSTTPTIANGNTKCNPKKRFSVGLSTEKPPQSQYAISWPIKGIALNKFVITVAPQKLICPQGKT